MKWLLALLIGLTLAGCQTAPVIRTEVQTVNVPVLVECLGDLPKEVIALKTQYTEEQWNQLTTEQRNNLVIAQALDRKVYGDRLTAASAGCLGDGP